MDLEVYIDGHEYEKRRFGDIESAVEFMSHRPHEKWIVDTTDAVRRQIRRRIREITGVDQGQE